MISKRTKAALKIRKDNGILLGNRTNLAEAQRLGMERRQANAKLRLDEFEREFEDVRGAGAKTAQEIAHALNERAFMTARGQKWTAGNVARAFGKLKARRNEFEPATASSREEADPSSHENWQQFSF